MCKYMPVSKGSGMSKRIANGTMAGVSIPLYKEMMEQCHSFNSRLMAERRIRLPYLDSQTGVAQNHSNLLFEARHRGPGLLHEQVYSYPNKRWKKRPRRTPLLDFPYGLPKKQESINGHLVASTSGSDHTNLNENSNDSSNHLIEADTVSDIQDAGAEDFDDDEDYYNEDSSRKNRRKNKGKGGRSSRRTERDEEREKPHVCMYCGKRYKHRPGLNYHIQHIHPDELDADEEYTPGRVGRSTPNIVDQDSNPGINSKSSAMPSSSRSGSVAGSNAGDDFDEDEKQTRSKRKRQAQNSAYCDFCLGDAGENKKTGKAEELVSCSDCGRSGHPTCLQFTEIMTMNVKKYRWQCIECKSCHLCGTSDNDDQLLFCDDCDRGYHMYCLDPPMEEPPEGSWICSLCEADRKVREGKRR